MNIGFSLSNNQGLTDVQEVVRTAVRAEELGFDSVWASDHVFNVSYVYERLGNRPYYDPMTIRVMLGTSVLVLPYHNPGLCRCPDPAGDAGHQRPSPALP